MTPSELHPGEYKLFSHVCNPFGGDPRELDWRKKSSWDYNDRFHCYMVYLDMGLTIPALYMGKNPARMVHEKLQTPIFEAILGCLERVK